MCMYIYIYIYIYVYTYVYIYIYIYIFCTPHRELFKRQPTGAAESSAGAPVSPAKRLVRSTPRDRDRS